MRAIQQREYGQVDQLALVDIDRPTPGPDQVLIRVHAASVNMADWHLMTGEPLLARLALGVKAPKQQVRGVDLAGVVEQVGEAVSDFQPGDRVFGCADGAFADYAVAASKRLAHLPAGVSFEHASTLGTAARTALQALRAAGIEGPGSGAGRSVLVIGAAGGVGSFAVQLAALAGATVTGVCSTAKLDFVRGLGATEVVDYTKGPVTGRFDVVVDIAGARSIGEGKQLLTDRGTLVIVGGEGGGALLGPSSRMMAAPFASLFSKQKVLGIFQTERRDDLEALAELVATGALVPAVEQTLPLEHAPQAVAHLAAGRALGKTVLSITT